MTRVVVRIEIQQPSLLEARGWDDAPPPISIELAESGRFTAALALVVARELAGAVLSRLHHHASRGGPTISEGPRENTQPKEEQDASTIAQRRHGALADPVSDEG